MRSGRFVTGLAKKALLPALLTLPMMAQSTEMNTAEIGKVSPALQQAQEGLIDGELWNRAGMNKRDRSIVTVAAMIARDQPHQLPVEINRALDNGVTPKEISEIINHLAYYAGWGNALDAVAATAPVFAERGISKEQLPAVDPELLSIDEEAEAKRQNFVSGEYESTSAGVVKYTRDALFRGLWLRPDLAPRDRSLVTVSALIAVGQSEQVPFHLNKAMDNGLKPEEVSEVLTQLAFYAGWPKVFSALPVVKKVLADRPAQ